MAGFDNDNIYGANLDLDNGGAVRASPRAGETTLLQAYDVDGAAYTTFGTLTSNNTPTFDLSTSVTKGGEEIPTASSNTWIPELQFGGASVGITYAARSASYSRIGNIVTFTLSVELSNKGSSTGAATFTGLPFTVANTTIWAISSNALTFSGMVNARNGGASTTISLDQWASGGSRTQLSDTAFANSTFVQISGSYLV